MVVGHKRQTNRIQGIDELCNDLRTEVDNIAEWLRQNKLSLNTDETEYMVVGHKRQTNCIQGPLEVNINGGPIKRVKKVKYLDTGSYQGRRCMPRYSFPCL